MKNPKEIGLIIIALVIAVSCCLFLSLLIAGGTFAFLGSYFGKVWLSGIAWIILIGVVILIFISLRKETKK